MTKEVMIAIQGLQSADEDQSDQVEVIIPGEYYYRNNKHYLMFEEPIEGADEVAKSTIKLAPDYMELIRRGSLNTHMVFETNKKNITYYNTPFGNIPMGIDARKVKLEEEEDQIRAEIHYLLDMNSQYVSDSTIHIQVRPRKNAGLHLS